MKSINFLIPHYSVPGPLKFPRYSVTKISLEGGGLHQPVPDITHFDAWAVSRLCKHIYIYILGFAQAAANKTYITIYRFPF